MGIYTSPHLLGMVVIAGAAGFSPPLRSASFAGLFTWRGRNFGRDPIFDPYRVNMFHRKWELIYLVWAQF